MALNPASHNPAGLKTGPASGQPPAASAEATAAIIGSAKEDLMGQHDGGHDRGDKEAGTKVKSAKELDKEKKKAEKQKKFEEKKAKTTVASGSAELSKSKEKKAKQETVKEDALPEYKEPTPPGQKKILQSLDDPYHKAYIPKVVESGWYAWWEKSGFFEPELGPDGKIKQQGSFIIPEPPPNVTGVLHMGHALPNALQDTLIRWNRMRGLTTLWVPGCDHASISTQTVVEKMLRRQGISRIDLGRKKFLETVSEWKEEKKDNINNVIRRMGGSLDWTRERFTMDEGHTIATVEHFVRLHEEGLIYRANRLVNWCTALNTAISNIEIDSKELEGRSLLSLPGYDRKVEFGVMTHFYYTIDGSDEKIEIATTRPETMLGDTGIAICPTEARWKHLVGKNARHPFIKDRLLPIFTDDHVKEGLGTGAMKVTPAHDLADYDIGKRHNLEFINILTDDGLMNENTGDFKGMKRYDARYKVVEAWKNCGLYVKSVNNPMVIPVCQKTGDVIEYILKPQWWMNMRSMADTAIKAVEDGDIAIKPETAERDYHRWLKDINPWCISRQLWWGHQIPAYFAVVEGEPNDRSDSSRWVAGRSKEEAEQKAKAKFPGKALKLEQDEDVFDTWFTSSLWPFSIMGWPKNTSDMELFYPTSLLETGWDILTFWVVRMVMLGIKLTGKVPFKEVYCHSLVRDSEGRKMSKSLGNVIDPIDVMEGITLERLQHKLQTGNLDPKELATATKWQKSSFPDGIPECGADALRFSLINYTTGGGDINFDIKVMHGYRRFCNKIYQATKYVLGKLPPDFRPLPSATKSGKEAVAELWILHKLTTTAGQVNKALAAREFSDATQSSYHFWYNNLCDVYIENSKTIIQDGTPEERESAQQTLYTTLEGALTLIHPFMPFLTEELWQRLPRRPGDSCPSIVKAAFPQYDKSLDDPASEEAYELVLGVSKAVRSLAAAYDIKDNAIIYVKPHSSQASDTCKEQLPSIKSLGGRATYGSSSLVTVLSSDDVDPSGCIPQAVGASCAVFLFVKDRIDIDKEIEKAKTRRDRSSETIKKQRAIINGDGWAKMKEEAQRVEKKKLEDAESEVALLEGSISQFQQLRLD
ncbi:uncharacterized protein KY384_008488 [Bacidia gigantensis]|uniref:uncharacterized protein n=1 Tax=Bacidia gigantensis TaxID=2732470 RepID=UPI001D05993A|nr:uncharacterized protein KY384_008488 [Bacidia gigantensis]KAG8527059.1 hypothetical protein KY384_008488 [Bacidia gigantensis]